MKFIPRVYNSYQRGHTKTRRSKPLLLQLFGSVALLNLSETPECRADIIQRGGIHSLYLAAEKVQAHSDLWFILYYIFMRFTKCGGEFSLVSLEFFNRLSAITIALGTDAATDDRIVYMAPIGVSRLLDFAARQLLQNMRPPKDPKQLLFENDLGSSSVSQQLEGLGLAPHLLEEADSSGSASCIHCQAYCHPHLSIRKYQMHRSKRASLDWLCSKTCCALEDEFPSRPFFRFRPGGWIITLNSSTKSNKPFWKDTKICFSQSYIF